MDLGLPWQPTIGHWVSPSFSANMIVVLMAMVIVMVITEKIMTKEMNHSITLTKEIESCIQRVIHLDEARFTPGSQGWLKAQTTNRL